MWQLDRSGCWSVCGTGGESLRARAWASGVMVVDEGVAGDEEGPEGAGGTEAVAELEGHAAEVEEEHRAAAAAAGKRVTRKL